MSKKHNATVVFAIHLCFSLLTGLLFMMNIAAAEIYFNDGHMFADAEIAETF